ncbi:MAG: F0F1 ATP synthase subunit B [Pirellulales bacterium]|nr:F0F1 ATP synthase subunit B [Pirellulales bacterium]
MWTGKLPAIAAAFILAAAIVAARPCNVYASAGNEAAHAANAHGGSGEPDPLDWKADLAIWSAVVFIGLLLVLYGTAWGPLTEGLSKREKHIADQIAQAGAANRQAKELLSQHEQKLAEAAQEVRAILDKARRDAEETAREREAKAEADAKARLERAEKEIAAATAAAAKELADRSAKLAVDLAGKIVKAKLNPKDHAQLIEQAVSGFNVSREGGKFASRN